VVMAGVLWYVCVGVKARSSSTNEDGFTDRQRTPPSFIQKLCASNLLVSVELDSLPSLLSSEGRSRGHSGMCRRGCLRDLHAARGALHRNHSSSSIALRK
jgi:hypothetical protein